jgi:23S rRNA pseudouridine1911/1915/1917 synthase
MNFSDIDVIYEDNHLIIINKKASQIVQGDKTGDIPLSELLKDYLKVKYNKPGNVFVGVVHRIDRPVSGAVIFAKTSKALSRLNDMLKTNDIKKTYWAVIRKNDKINPAGTLIHYLIKNEAKNISMVYNKPIEKSLKAELNYTVIQTVNDYFLLQINLITGRHHQIRAQLSAIGCPIIGDIKYGYARANKDKSIHLHAKKIEFIHPVSKIPILVEAPLPNDVIWNKFSVNN